jgi:glycosyltransferase involved in cell wall biosynthesis
MIRGRRRASKSTRGKTFDPRRGLAPVRVSVVLPVFEEAAMLEDLFARLRGSLSREKLEFEIVAVDDGSGDETQQVLRELASRIPQVVLVRHLRNRGNGAALRSGIRVARGEIVVTMDADGQHAPEDIPTLVSRIPPYDLVIGARTGSYGGSWYRNAANRFYNFFSSWLSRTAIDDLTSGFRAMRRDVALHFLPLFPQGFSAPTTTTLAFLKAGYSVAFVPIHVGQRSAGRSKIRLWEDGLRFLRLIVRMIVLYDPMRIFFPVGSVMAVLGLLAWIAGLIHAGRLVLPNSAIFLFSSALLVWLLGLISEQISSMRVTYHADEEILVMRSDEDQGHLGEG